MSEKGKIPDNWRVSCVAPVYKGKEDRNECSSYGGISIVTGPVLLRNMYNRIVIGKVVTFTEGQLGYE